MPSILKVKIIAARNLPVMDRATELTDAFVEIHFADYEVMRTGIKRRTLNPIWNEDFRLEISDDADLQNEPLELKVLDYDQITYNDAIGSLFIDLNPLLTWDSNSQVSGWLPIYDTLNGIRGELNVQVKIQFFGDMNPFKDSSAGVQFYSSNSFSANYPITNVFGLVSALDTDDDPEYHWTDNFRAPRTSNEARIRLLFRLSGKLRRILGRKVLELGGNAVVGYQQFFDLEEETRTITAKAIGCAVYMSSPTNTLLLKGASSVQFPTPAVPTGNIAVLENLNDSAEESDPNQPTTIDTSMHLNAKNQSNNTCLDNEPESSLIARVPTTPTSPGLGPTQPVYNKISEVVILTPQLYPANAIKGTGGFVTATSVKIIDNDETETREQWWTELRDEIKSHARTLNCTYVLGYSESTTNHDDLIILHCYGTAANLSPDFTAGANFENVLDFSHSSSSPLPPVNPINGNSEQHSPVISDDPNFPTLEKKISLKWPGPQKKRLDCRSCHITYSHHQSPFPMSIYKCTICKKKHVPEMLLASCEPPPELQKIGQPMLLEAHVCRQKKNKPGESNATSVSESLPFAQYDLHRQIMYKLRLYGLNAVFGLKIQVSVGENMLVAVATGTAMFIRALPPPPVLKVFRNLDIVDEEDEDLMEIQRKIVQMSEQNRILLDNEIQKILSMEEQDFSTAITNHPSSIPDSNSAIKPGYPSLLTSSDDSSDDSEVEGGLTASGYTKGNMSAIMPGNAAVVSPNITSPQQKNIVIQIDDEQDEDLVLLTNTPVPPDFLMMNIETLRKPLGTTSNAFKTQSITVLKKGTIGVVSHHPNRQLSNIFKEMYQDLVTQLGYFQNCTVAGLNYDLQILEENSILIRMTAVAMSTIMDFPDPYEIKPTSNPNIVDTDALFVATESAETGCVDIKYSPEWQSQRWSLFRPIESQILEISQSSELIGNSLFPPTSIEVPSFSSPVTVSAISSFFPKARQLFRERTQLSDFVTSGSASSISSEESNGSVMFDTIEEDEFEDQQQNSLSATKQPSDTNFDDTIGSSNRMKEKLSQMNNQNLYNSLTSFCSTQSANQQQTLRPSLKLLQHHRTGSQAPLVEISSLSYIPNTKVDKFLGRYCMHFIKETTLSYENNTIHHGSETFNHNFLTELYGIARSYARCLGGNALLSFKIEQSFFEQSIKNQGYALLSISADVVQLIRQ